MHCCERDACHGFKSHPKKHIICVLGVVLCMLHVHTNFRCIYVEVMCNDITTLRREFTSAEGPHKFFWLLWHRTIVCMSSSRLTYGARATFRTVSQILWGDAWLCHNLFAWVHFWWGHVAIIWDTSLTSYCSAKVIPGIRVDVRGSSQFWDTVP